MFLNKPTSLARALCAVIFIGCSALAHPQPVVPPKVVNLSDSPILASGRGPASNLLLSLSVEFPTVGAAYRQTTYDNTLRTLGYWDADTCYRYATDGLPSEVAANVPGVGAPEGFFRRVRAASNFQCGGAGEYSGNFLNWATLSAVDSLRYALTGGDRIVDTVTQTILQRADLPFEFYRGGYAPAKVVTDARKYTPFTGTVQLATCRYVLYLGTAAGPTGSACGAPGTNGNLAQLRTAVEVCDSIEGPTRTDLCRKQKSNSYKPTGLMQQYADNIRFAAFGYAQDSGNSRYGGVLRAPMKYVGKRAYDAAFNETTNTAPEWDEDTGIFIDAPLPLQAGTTYSGVANYLNKFGRVTYATRPIATELLSATQYKGNDPVSELYYEGLRYLQGQSPSPQVTATPFTPAMYDGFPIYTNWRSTSVPDPITAGCQNTSIIQIADANTHNDKTIPGNSRTDGAGDSARGVGPGEPNAVTWTDLVGNYESRPGLGNLPTGAGGNSASYYIAGLAYWANTRPIRTDKPAIRVKTYVIDVNEDGNGTIGATQRAAQLYLAAKYGGFDDANNDGNPFSIPPSGAAAVTKWASGVDNDQKPLPKTFFLASSPQKMVDSLRAAFASQARSTGTLSGGSVSSSKIATTSTGSDAYVTRLDAQNDAGDVLDFKLKLDPTTMSVTVDNAPSASASDTLTGSSTKGIAPYAITSRKIFTTKTDGTGIALASYSDLDAAQKTLFDTNPDTGVNDGLGARRVQYLRGSRVDEVSYSTASVSKPFRNRTSLLASIVSSAPVYVGKKPSSGIAGTGYDAFYKSLVRQEAVYVGTNNGYLHAFSADLKKELFAFIPRALMGQLPATTSPYFARKPMLDAVPIISEAQIGTTWKSLLVAGYGGGSQGVFALDVTSPDTFAASNVLWDFSDLDDPQMGNVTSPPQILKFRTSTNTYRWFVVVPSGYNNNKDDTPTGTTPIRHDVTNQTALFLLAADKAPTAAWVLGSNYYRIRLPVSAPYVNPAIVNGLSSPGVDLGLDNEVQRLYAGDVQGNLWKFDFTLIKDAFSSNANMQKVLADFNTAGAKPLFSAKDNNGVGQPITIQPIVGTGPGRSNVGVFGTGKFIETSDTTTAANTQQAMYGVWDDLTNTASSRIDDVAKLATRTATGGGTAATFTITGDGFTYGYPVTQTKKMGWFFNLPGVANGERQVTNLAVSGGYVYFNTLQRAPTTGSACAAYGGRRCAVSGAFGVSYGASCDVSTEGFLPSPVIVEPPATITESSGKGISISETQPFAVTFVGTPITGAGSGSAGKPLVATAVRQRENVGRLNWREVVDYDKLKEKLK